MTSEDEAKRDLARLENEREKLFGAPPAMAEDENDPAERWGKRIARILMPIIAAAFVLHLAVTYWPRH